MDECWFQSYIAAHLKKSFVQSQITEMNNDTFDIEIRTPENKVFLIQISEIE